MDYFYELTFVNRHGEKRVEYYTEKYPSTWFEVWDKNITARPCIGEDSVATESIPYFTERIICEGMEHNPGFSGDFALRIMNEITDLTYELGASCEMRINDGLLTIRVVNRPEINIQRTIEENDWDISDQKSVRIYGKPLIKFGHCYNGVWYIPDFYSYQEDIFSELVCCLFPDIRSVRFYDDGGCVTIEITAYSANALREALITVFHLDATGVEPEVVHKKDGELQYVKYTIRHSTF